jgi:hypothetical protein
MPLKNQVLPHQFACFGRMIVVLGPLLFLCQINDLPECVKSQVRLFADDCLLYRQIKNREDHILLQNDLTCMMSL